MKNLKVSWVRDGRIVWVVVPVDEVESLDGTLVFRDASAEICLVIPEGKLLGAVEATEDTDA